MTPFAKVTRSGSSPKRVEPNHVADAPEPGDHLVGDEERTGVAHDLPHAGEIALGGEADAARTDHRLAEERGDPLGADPVDRLGELVGRVPGDEGDIGDEVTGADPVRLDPGHGRAVGVHAVVRPGAGQDHGALGLPELVEVAPRELRRRVDRIGAARGEEHLAARDRRDRGKPVGEVEHRPRRVFAEGVVRVQRLQLRRDRLGDLAAAVADVRVPEAAGAVEVAPARLVPDVAAVAARDDELVPVDGAHVREPVPEVRHAREASALEASAQRIRAAQERGGADARVVRDGRRKLGFRLGAASLGGERLGRKEARLGFGCARADLPEQGRAAPKLALGGRTRRVEPGVCGRERR